MEVNKKYVLDFIVKETELIESILEEYCDANNNTSGEIEYCKFLDRTLDFYVGEYNFFINKVAN